jgi:hypothetical protein
MIATVFDSHAVLQLLWSATAASLLVCISFAFALRAVSNASAARRVGRANSALAHMLTACLAGVVCLAAIGAGVVILIDG